MMGTKTIVGLVVNKVCLLLYKVRVRKMHYAPTGTKTQCLHRLLATSAKRQCTSGRQTGAAVLGARSYQQWPSMVCTRCRCVAMQSRCNSARPIDPPPPPPPQELHVVVHRAYRRASKQQGAVESRAIAPKGPLAMVIEFRDNGARLVQVTATTELKELSAAKALYVTVSAASLPAQGVGGAEHGGGSDRAATSSDAEELIDDGTSLVLVELSLAGCCGVQSTHGGLVLASNYLGQPSAPGPKRASKKCSSQLMPAAATGLFLP